MLSILVTSSAGRLSQLRIVDVPAGREVRPLISL
jgi:hypothetical protein